MHKCSEELQTVKVLQDYRVKGPDRIVALFDQFLGCRSRDLHHKRPGTRTGGDRYLLHHRIIPTRGSDPTLWIFLRK